MFDMFWAIKWENETLFVDLNNTKFKVFFVRLANYIGSNFEVFCFTFFIGRSSLAYQWTLVSEKITKYHDGFKELLLPLEQ